MSDQDGAPEMSAQSRAVVISDAEEQLIYAYLSGNEKDIAAAKDNLSIAHDMSVGQPSSAVIERLIKNDPINAVKAGLLNPE
jgi:hypothetical protein